MTSSERGSDIDPAEVADTADADDAADIDAAELEAAQDDAERERHQVRSALIGLAVLIVVVVLTGMAIYTVVTRSTDQPPDPGVSRQAPAPPAGP